jgi:hypothetical protein
MTYMTITQFKGTRSVRIDLAAMRSDGVAMAPEIARLPRDVMETHWLHACEEAPGKWVIDNDELTEFSTATEADEFMLALTAAELNLSRS